MADSHDEPFPVDAVAGTVEEGMSPQCAQELSSSLPSIPHTPKFKRLTNTDRAFALRYKANGLTQTQIAQRLNCDQATISRWLSTCEDTTAEATAYLRAQALPMAEKVVQRGRPSDLVKVLQGVSVIAMEGPSQGITIYVGGDARVGLLVQGGPSAPTIEP